MLHMPANINLTHKNKSAIYYKTEKNQLKTVDKNDEFYLSPENVEISFARTAESIKNNTCTVITDIEKHVDDVWNEVFPEDSNS